MEAIKKLKGRKKYKIDLNLYVFFKKLYTVIFYL